MKYSAQKFNLSNPIILIRSKPYLLAPNTQLLSAPNLHHLSSYYNQNHQTLSEPLIRNSESSWEPPADRDPTQNSKTLFDCPYHNFNQETFDINSIIL